MANRSYLYTCDESPAAGRAVKPRGLCEFNYGIPIVHKLMVASAPRVVRSAIWGDHDIGILADRAGAIERTLAFVDKLSAGELAEQDAWNEEVAGMKQFLAAVPPSKYVLLETGEIYEMTEPDAAAIVGAVKRLADTEIPAVAARAARAVAGQEDAWLSELRRGWQDMEAGPGYWSDVLYFSFDS